MPIPLPKAYVAWSSGKDSAFALHIARTAGELDVVGLLTTVNEDPATGGHVAVHRVRRTVLAAQAAALGLPILEVMLPSPCPNPTYEAAFTTALAQLRAQGVTHLVFGDLYLADIRAYRERAMAGSGVTPVFPLWGMDTRALARTMIESGMVAHLACIDRSRLPEDIVGRRFDAELLASLPVTVDPCGEGGEFHTVVSDAPGFRASLPLRAGATIVRDGFAFADFDL